MPQLKLVENAGSVQFSKNINNFGEQTLGNNNLKFTLCDLNDYSVRPFGNLFTSFNLPITQTQKHSFNTTYQNTSFQYFSNINKIVVTEIPQNTYGELIDGKTFFIKVPIISGNTVGTINCYASYFLKDNTDTNTSVMNSQYSDANLNSGYFGITPSISNQNNSNVAYLFSDSIAKPKIGYNYVVDLISSYTLTTSSTLSNHVSYYRGINTIPFNFIVGKQYRVTLSNILKYDGSYSISLIATISASLNNDPNSINLRLPNVTNFSLDSSNRGVRSFNYNTTIASSSLSISTYNGSSPNDLVVGFTLKIEELSLIEGSWSRWTQGNKFIPSLGSLNGKQPANFSDPNGILIDRPIGIVYLDKGFAVFTDPEIVNNFYYSGATSGITTNSDPNFTQIYYNSSLASATFNSIYTDYVQSVMCLAMPNEFYTSNNPTFTEVYGSNGINNTSNDPVYITEIGLYNQYGELIAIAKTSEPIAKNKANMVAFNIDLKL